MPFPGSQLAETIEIAYFLHQWIWILRFIGYVIIGYSFFTFFRSEMALWKKLILILPVLIYAGITYIIQTKMMADAMFLQAKTVAFSSINESSYKDDVILIGTEINGEAKAYPLEYVGYHHQVRDTIGGQPIMVTYCTVCRTGRIWDPVIDGVNQEFRLVGMDHFNAMFEDKATGSWWRQGTGEAIAGPSKGKTMQEFTIYQLSKAEWKKRFPQSLVMLPDPNFTKQYDRMKGYASGKNESDLTGTNKQSWKDKSWVIGVIVNKESKAYDWNYVVKNRYINDKLNGVPILISMASDNASFYVWNRMVDNTQLNLKLDSSGNYIDAGTQTTWDKTGRCIDGLLLGKRLQVLPAYQEFWHSWRTFHPDTKTYGRTE